MINSAKTYNRMVRDIFEQLQASPKCVPNYIFVTMDIDALDPDCPPMVTSFATGKLLRVVFGELYKIVSVGATAVRVQLQFRGQLITFNIPYNAILTVIDLERTFSFSRRRDHNSETIEGSYEVETEEATPDTTNVVLFSDHFKKRRSKDNKPQPPKGVA